MRVLAIDQGTSATKALVVEADGAVVGEATVPVPVSADDAGAVEVDPDDLWTSVLGAGQAALAAAGGSIDAVGLANQGETVLAWDRASGTPIGRALVWQDRRSAALCERLSADGWAERLAAITGLELDPYFSAPKMAWLREQVGDGPAVTTTDTWLLHRLCGAFVTDAATASRSLLLDLDAVQWSDGACAAFGIDPRSLPPVVANATVVGETKAFGDRAVPVSGVCVDQQAALLAQSCFEAGEAKCTYGTGAFLLASTGAAPTRSANGLVGCVAWQLPEGSSWCLDGQLFTVGAAVSWLQSVGLIDDPADLDRLGGAATAADGRGVTFVPGLAGLAAPFWKPNARGAFVGLGMATDRADLVRAVIDGIACSVALLARAIEADLGAPLTRLRVDGGLTRSRTLLQAQADVLQVPVDVYPSPHATALGVAALARLGAGGAPDARTAVGPWSPVAAVEPEIGPEQAEARIARWLAAATATMDL